MGGYLWPPGIAQGGLAKVSLPVQAEFLCYVPPDPLGLPKGFGKSQLVGASKRVSSASWDRPRALAKAGSLT